MKKEKRWFGFLKFKENKKFAFFDLVFRSDNKVFSNPIVSSLFFI